eukprot:CAMPEP_0198552030 /NCGR_PEP_ID=MMETSP1462-20131121/77886_1 /TAXON_ID=1333877 /ORGANISM="Brandtodinium nutriculum, Strain RCC3387" /LENGTH=91 /DNA_ID=CAMNT_0044282679 /DNA_START=21 /DNA_END=294 /DNA_ORIENTATION=-
MQAIASEEDLHQSALRPIDEVGAALQAQAPSGNGREFVFRANPLTEAAPWPAPLDDPLPHASPRGQDPIVQLQRTIARYGGDKPAPLAPQP